MGLDLKRREVLGELLGREVYLEFLGQRKLGRICSVYRDPETGETTAEVEWTTGIMGEARLPRLKFIEEGEGS